LVNNTIVRSWLRCIHFFAARWHHGQYRQQHFRRRRWWRAGQLGRSRRSE
jgi:hypothetical protein